MTKVAAQRRVALRRDRKAKDSRIVRRYKVVRQPNFRRSVMKAIAALKEKNGSSLADIKRYMNRSMGLDVKAWLPQLKEFFGSAIKSGLLKMSEGKYKVAAKRRRRSSGKRKGAASAGGRRRRRRSGGKKSGGSKKRRSGRKGKASSGRRRRRSRKAPVAM